MESNKTTEYGLDGMIVNALARNYFYLKGTFKGIANDVNLPKEVKSLTNPYTAIGFESEEDFNRQLSKLNPNSFVDSIGKMTTSKVVKHFGDYLKGFKIGKVPGSAMTYDEFFEKTRYSSLTNRLAVFDYLNNSELTELLEQYYPEEADVPKQDIVQEGVYLGAYYYKEDIELPDPNEVLAYMIGLDFLPSAKLVSLTSDKLNDIMTHELMNFEHLTDLYKELALFAHMHNTSVYTLLVKLDLQIFNHMKTFKDNILLLSNKEEIITFITADSLTLLKVEEEDFNRMYNENVLNEITMNETVYTLTDDGNTVETEKAIEPYLNSLEIPLWKFLRFKERPFEPNNLVRSEQ